MNTNVIFDPLFPWEVLAGLAVVFALLLVFAGWRGLLGAGLRALGVSAILLALANPSLQEEQREPLTDIALVLVDETASQRIADRAVQTEAALAELSAAIERRPNTELRLVRLGDAPGDGGSLAMSALSEALSEIPSARLAGAVLLSDGQVHDVDGAPSLPAPFHLLLTGQPEDWDRRLVVKTAPSFGIIGEEVMITLRIEDQGAVPEAMRASRANLTVSVDGGRPFTAQLPIGRDIEVPLVLDHGGLNVVQLLDPDEEAFPFDGRTVFESMQGSLRFETLKAKGLRDAYLERLAMRRDALSLLARRTGWQFMTHHTGGPAEPALMWLYRALDRGA